MFSPIKAIATGAIVFALGGVLLLAQPMPRQDADTPAAVSASKDPSASSEPTRRDFIEWGSKRIYYTPPPRWSSVPFLEGIENGSPPFVRFDVHDVERVQTGCSAEDPADPEPIFAAVGPTTEELTDAIVNQTWLHRSGPTDVTVSGYPAKRLVVINDAELPPCHGGDGSIWPWEAPDDSELYMASGGWVILVMADVEGERLVFTALAGYPIEGFETTMTALEADADALIASMEIVDADPLRPAWVTGTIPWSGRQVGTTERSTGNGVTKAYGQHWEDMGPINASDPRLSGRLASIWNEETHRVEGVGPFTVHVGSYRIDNDEGAWLGGYTGLNRGGGSVGGTISSETILLDGSGAYEGLTAYVLFDLSANPTTLTGVIFPGDMPPIATFE